MTVTRTRIFSIMILAALVSLHSASHALAAAASQTSHQSFVQTSADVNQCSGIPVIVTIVGDTLLHMTARPDHTVSMTVATSGTITLVPVVEGQPTYAGHLTDLFSGYGTVDPATGEIFARTATSVHNVALHGSDGSLIQVHGIMHETIKPDGTVAVSFDRGTYTCP